MATIAELQSYQRKASAHTRNTVVCSPFQLYIHPTDTFRFFNYAIPDAPVEVLTRDDLARLRVAFAKQGRMMRFEFIHEYTPRLRGLLEGLGVPLESDTPLLVCTQETWHDVAGPQGLEILRLTADSPETYLAAQITVSSRGFGGDGREVNAERIADLRRRLRLGSGYYLALLDGAPVGVGAYMVPLEGFSELVGIATLPEYRRQGIAGAVTAAMARQLFDEGVRTAFLTAADDAASRVYQRAGFSRVGTGLAFCEE